MAAINYGQVERKSGTLRLTYGRQDALEILDLLRAEELQSLSVQCETDYQLLGQVLPMGKTRIICENIFAIDELPALKQRVQALPESDSIQIAFRYDRAIERFLRWFPESIDEQTD